MRFVGTTQGGAGALRRLAGGAGAVGRARAALAVDPLGLDGVESGVLDGQAAGDDPHGCLPAPDPPIVLAEPGAHHPSPMVLAPKWVRL